MTCAENFVVNCVFFVLSEASIDFLCLSNPLTVLPSVWFIKTISNFVAAGVGLDILRTVVLALFPYYGIIKVKIVLSLGK
jgi:hypothetical protein